MYECSDNGTEKPCDGEGNGNKIQGHGKCKVDRLRIIVFGK